jgi:ribonuclease HI
VLHAEASALLRRVPRHALVYIPRAENARADALANEAMDSRASRARHFF